MGCLPSEGMLGSSAGCVRSRSFDRMTVKLLQQLFPYFGFPCCRFPFCFGSPLSRFSSESTLLARLSGTAQPDLLSLWTRPLPLSEEERWVRQFGHRSLVSARVGRAGAPSGPAHSEVCVCVCVCVCWCPFLRRRGAAHSVEGLQESQEVSFRLTC